MIIEKGENVIHNRKRKSEYALQGDNRGAALMVAVVIIGVLLVFTFSLLLVTYTLYSSQNKNAASKRNAEAANTLSKALTTELTETDGELWRYLRFNICQENTWPYYDPDYTGEGHDESAAFRYFDVNVNYIQKYFGSTVSVPQEGSTEVNEDLQNSMEGFPGSVKLCIYWAPPESLVKDDHPLISVQEIMSNKKGIRLYVEVICETANQSYVVKNEFQLRVVSTETLEKNKLNAYSAVKAYKPLSTTVFDVNEGWIWEFVTRE